MNEYELLKVEFFKIIESKVFGTYKQNAYIHSIEVETLCKIIGQKRGLDIEACAIMGLFHDVSKYVNRSSRLHGIYSATMLETLFEKYPYHLSNEVLEAIRVHSDKENTHSEYAEVLKDADCYASYLEEPNQTLSNAREKRIKKVEDE